MEALIPILDCAPPGAQHGVDARDLHRFLGVGRDFSTWLRDRVMAYGFIEGRDFAKFHHSPEPGSGNRGARIDFVLSLDMAKELAMVERTERGRQARAYFIECERRALEAARASAPSLEDPAALRELLLGYTERVLTLEAQAAELRPKAETYDRVMEAPDTFGFRETCKMLGRSHGVTEAQVRAALFGAGLVQRIDRRMIPTYRGTSRGYVTTRMRDWSDDFGVVHAKPELRITSKGVAWLDQRFAKEPAA